MKNTLFMTLLSLIVVGGLGFGQQQSIAFKVDSPPTANVTGVTYGNPSHPGAGSTLYYWVATTYATGSVLNPNSQSIDNVTTTDPSVAHGITVSWNPVVGAISYSILRTSSPVVPTIPCTCLVGTATAGATFMVDLGGALGAFAPTLATPATGELRLNNTLYFPPAFEFMVNGVLGNLAIGILNSSIIYSPNFITNVKACGAKGDGVTDDTVAIQACIDLNKPSNTVINAGTTGKQQAILFPAGTYQVSIPLKFYSGSMLLGYGPSSNIRATNGFVGTGVLVGSNTGIPGVNRVEQVVISDLQISEGTTPVTALDLSVVSNALNSTFQNLQMNTTTGINAMGYTQACTFRSFLFRGAAIDQLINLTGNFNLLDNWDLEGTGNTSTNPFIAISNTGNGANQNTLHHILLEGGGSTNKHLIDGNGATAIVIDDFWPEATNTDGYSIKLANNTTATLRNLHTSNITKMKLGFSTNTIVSIDYVNFAVEANPADILIVDSTSYVYLDYLYTRRNAQLFPLGSHIIPKFGVASTVVTTPIAGMSPISIGSISPTMNLLMNPSFEAGFFGWSIAGGAGHTEAFVQSEVSQGLELQDTITVNGSYQVKQSFIVPTAWIGVPITISFMAKHTGTGYTSALTNGAGVANSTDGFRAIAGAGWTLVSQTFIPSAAGTMTVGAYMVGVDTTTVVFLDDFQLSFGNKGNQNSFKMGSFEVNGSTRTAVTAVPATGTWKVGDMVWNSTPSELGTATSKYVISGWVCTVAGSPGTWLQMRTLTGN